MNADTIPVARTPVGGYGDTFPDPILSACTDPIIDGAPDMRGLWQVVEAIVGAAAAGVAAIETIQGDFRDLDGLRRRAEKVRRDGYRGMLAIHPAQVEVINAAFTPSEEEIAAAQEIVDLFAANPGVGTIGYKGAMLDRPHLARARLLLEQAGR